MNWNEVKAIQICVDERNRNGYTVRRHISCRFAVNSGGQETGSDKRNTHGQASFFTGNPVISVKAFDMGFADTGYGIYGFIY
jgi:hypothetical protein